MGSGRTRVLAWTLALGGAAVCTFTLAVMSRIAIKIRLLADVGVVLLLLEVGIEINSFQFAANQRGILWAAAAQVLITGLLSGIAAFGFDVGAAGASLIGLSIAMSSSVVVVNIMRSRRRTKPIDRGRTF